VISDHTMLASVLLSLTRSPFFSLPPSSGCRTQKVCVCVCTFSLKLWTHVFFTQCVCAHRSHVRSLAAAVEADTAPTTSATGPQVSSTHVFSLTRLVLHVSIAHLYVLVGRYGCALRHLPLATCMWVVPGQRSSIGCMQNTTGASSF